MRYAALLLGLLALVGTGSTAQSEFTGLSLYAQTASSGPSEEPSSEPAAPEAVPPAATAAEESYRIRLDEDLAAVQSFRPAYPFWQHIFTIPDGRIAFGSAEDGRLLASFPTSGNWSRDAVWEDANLADSLDGQRLARQLNQRRAQVAKLLESTAGPLVHNPTRGRFLLPNAERYGSFLMEWGTIYERFGVPAEVGLAQAILESGLDGRARSRARALGFCQWLSRNWDFLNRLSPNVIEAYNQTTQAPYCAAYLSILAQMYGSFIPALSEHHAGGVNVGRTVINGERLGGTDVRQQYLLGSDFAAELRDISIRRYRELFRTYGRRSALYSEMVFGNMINVVKMTAQYPQTRIYAMRVPRAVTLTEITRKTGLKSQEVKRFNPALVRRVPARANLYLPFYVEEFGTDVSFWHRPPTTEYASALYDFLRLNAGVQRWHEASFESTLRRFQERFEDTDTEEGIVMATVLRYVISDLRTSRRAAILDNFRTSGRILELFRRGVQELGATIRGL